MLVQPLVPKTEKKMASSFLRRCELALAMLVAYMMGASFPIFSSFDVNRYSAVEVAREEVPSNKTSSVTLDYHQNKFDWTKSWCPTANCSGTELCYPCQRRWLIIVTPGRAGSTTLSEMMHRLPGVRVSGENNDAANKVDQFMTTFQDSIWGRLAGIPAWRHYRPRPEAWSCLSQHFFEVINPPDMGVGTNNQTFTMKEHLESSEETLILGFKTIRLLADAGRDYYPDPTPEFIQEKVDMMNRLFPCARFIVNTRSDIASLLNSWQNHMRKKKTTDEKLALVNYAHEEFYKAMGSERAFLVDSSNWTHNVGQLNEVLNWLGFNEKCHFEHLLEYNAKGKGFKHGQKNLNMDPECRLLQ